MDCNPVRYVLVVSRTQGSEKFRRLKWLVPDEVYVDGGENVFYLGNGLYGGLGGPGVYNQPIEAIRTALMNAYNDDLADVIKNVATLPEYNPATGYPGIGLITGDRGQPRNLDTKWVAMGRKCITTKPHAKRCDLNRRSGHSAERAEKRKGGY